MKTETECNACLFNVQLEHERFISAKKALQEILSYECVCPSRLDYINHCEKGNCVDCWIEATKGTVNG